MAYMWSIAICIGMNCGLYRVDDDFQRQIAKKDFELKFEACTN